MDTNKRARASLLIALTIANLYPSSFFMSVASAATADESLGLTNMSRRNTQRIAVQQAIITLSSESSDVDGDGYLEAPIMASGGGPTGGGLIPASSAAPKTDSYGSNLGYCSFDNGSINSSSGRITGQSSGYSAPVLAVVSAGIDNVFQTSCADIAAGSKGKGDDYVLVYNSTQIQMGNSGTLFYGDPVADVAALNSLDVASLKDGQVRLVKSTGQMYRWSTLSGAWSSLSAANMALSSISAATAANTINNAAYAQKWNWQLSTDSAGIEFGESAASSGGSGNQNVVRISTLAGSTASPLSVWVQGSEALRVDSANRQVLVSSGSLSAPGLSFIGAPDTGFYQGITTGGQNLMGASVGGRSAVELSYDGISIGLDAMQDNGSGNTANTAIGNSALSVLIGGQQNTAVGDYALASLWMNSNQNTAVGAKSGVAFPAMNKGMTKTTFLGYNALGNPAGASGSYMTAIGADSLVTTNSTIVLGRPSDVTVIGGTGSSGSAALLQVNGASQHIGRSSAPSGAAGMMYYDSSVNQFKFHNGIAWQNLSSPALSQITPAITNNTIDNAAYAQAWNWKLTGNTTALAIGETAASTGGSGTQYLMTIGTRASSTAVPLSVLSRGVEAFRVSSTSPQVIFNNGSVSAPSLTFSGSTTTGFLRDASRGGLAGSVGGVLSLKVNDYTTAIGRYALTSNDETIPRNNTGIGLQSLYTNTTGSQNTAVGAYSLAYNDTGYSNTAVGYNSLYNENGAYNSALGGSTLAQNFDGSGNSAFGYGALPNSRHGNNNTAVGYNAGSTDSNLSSASSITAIGTGTSASLPVAASTDVYMTVVGAGASVNSQNTVVLGRPSDFTVLGSSADDGSGARLQVTGGIRLVPSSAITTTSAGVMYFDSAQSQLKIYNGSAWQSLGAPALSQITAASANNTIANGAFSQSWNWSLTGNTTAMSIGESAASTGGSGSQYLMKIGTLAGSTAIPLSVVSRGVEVFRVDSTNPQVVFNNGTQAAPSVTFNGDQTTGLYYNYDTTNSVRSLNGSVNGQRALYVGWNVGLGIGALGPITTAYGNTALGHYSLSKNSSGLNNTAVGLNSLAKTVSGGYNVAVGAAALQFANGASFNSAIGEESLTNTTTGSSNAALGYSALYNNSSGSNNVAIGSRALGQNDTGNNNTAIGSAAGNSDFNTTNANRITLIGSGASANPATALSGDVYMTAVGSGASVTTQNTLVLGSAGVKTVIGATGDNGSAALLQVNGASQHVGLAAAPIGTAGMMYYDSTLNQFRGFNGTAWIGLGSPSLSQITPATATNSINNAAYSQSWNWSMTSTGVTAFSIGENVASTNGVDDNFGTPKQYLVKIGTLAGSTAIPLSVSSRGQEVFRIDPTNPQLLLNPGTAALPTLRFNSTDTTSGFYASDLYAISASLIGKRALHLDAANYNVYVGSQNVTPPNGTGQYNVGVGAKSMSGTNGTGNVAIGGSSLNANTSGSNNTAIGLNTLSTPSSSSNNTAVGANALNANNSANNVAVGVSALYGDASGSGHTAVGYQAGYSNSNVVGTSYISLFGAGANAQAPSTQTGAVYMSAIGAGSIVSTTNTVVLGRSADTTVIGATGNNGSGNKLQVTGGIQAVTGNITNTAGQFLGQSGTITAPTYSFTGNANTGMYVPGAGQLGLTLAGVRSLLVHNMTTGVGAYALQNLPAGSLNAQNTAIGGRAMYWTSTGAKNSALGYYALYSNTTGSYNIAVGGNSLQGNSTGSYNTGLGYYAAFGVAGDNNTAVGQMAMVSLAQGSANTVIGSNADIADYGSYISTVTLLGYGAYADFGASGTGNMYSTAIGALAKVTTPNTVVLGRPTDKTVIGASADNGSGNSLQVTGGIQAVTGNITNTAGQFLSQLGSAAAPAYSFVGNANTGLYMPGANQLSASVNGTRALWLAADSVGVGSGALSSSVAGTYNTAVGYSSLQAEAGAAPNGFGNVAVGAFASRSQNGGNYNVSVGYYSLSANNAGQVNTAVGAQSMNTLSSGDGNSGFGAHALPNLTSGSYNVAVGQQSGNNLNSGSNNTFVGTNSGFGGSASANYVTVVGAGAAADGTVTGDAYMTAIGAGAYVSSTNTIVIGRPTDNVAIGQSTNGPQQFYVNGTAGGTSAYAVSSDRRFKMNIVPLTSANAILGHLQGVSYEFNQAAFPNRKFESGRQLGFIAQQIEPFVPEVVRTDSAGYKSVQYSQLVPLTVEALKEHQGILQHFSRKDDVTLAVDIPTFEGNDAHFKRVEAETVRAKNLEVENARIAKLHAKEIEANSIEAKNVRTDVVKTGETDVFIGAGAFQPMFKPSAGEQYIVNATAEDGSSAFASVTLVGGKIVVTPIGGKGVDVIAYGSQVGIAGSNKRVKATWIRMS